jgi:carboxypeptidase Taq
MGPHDCRITTRYDQRFFNTAFFGILHEAGHGIYDQGLRPEQFGLPPGTYLSLGIHESQSRMWENLVGRSRAFWQHLFPQWQAAFPAAASGVKLDSLYWAINHVAPSLIRVEADEATYNLHIIVRFELEQALLNGQLAVGDVPAAWREKYQQYLGIEPKTDSEGCLQDIHWSAALIGYFPTYSLGNLYAAQFFEQADRDLGGLAAMFAHGEFQPLKKWLNEKIHHRGQCYSAAELVQLVTGQPLSPAPLIRHLRAKLGPLYGL